MDFVLGTPDCRRGARDEAAKAGAEVTENPLRPPGGKLGINQSAGPVLDLFIAASRLTALPISTAEDHQRGNAHGQQPQIRGFRHR